MSGGVDSSVAAWLLQNMGYKVEGLFMKNWEEDDNENYCNSSEDLYHTQNVCDQLKIILHKVNFSTEYWDNVFKKCIESFNIGNTPNPDILCNKEIKFKTFFEFAEKNLEADLIATGHYVRKKNINGINYLMKAIDKKKDQSYFLYTLNNQVISKSLFPIGNFHKNEIRKIAHKLKLINAAKKDSTGICFIGKRNFNKFLSKYCKKKQGNIINIKNGEIIGKHCGFMFYTIGQRKGLKIGGIKNNKNKFPWYVVDKNINLNQVIVAQGKNNKHLMSLGCHVHYLNFINFNILKNPLKCFVKTRYGQKDIYCTLYFIKDYFSANVYFNNPVKSITPGQSAVFYNKKICLGGGIIKYRLPVI